MHIVGVVCEYNPFHTGHRWQLEELRRRFGRDTGVICVMSGNFVQRGDFAIVRKHVRAAAAIRGGADLVLELPLPWSLSSAESFAMGGAEVLVGTGLVDTLAFGSECAEINAIRRTASYLLTEDFAQTLRSELKAGDSFASARERTAAKALGEAAAVLKQPNDILGVEYCKALQRLQSGIVPLALPRMGSGHDGLPAGAFAPASYIRERILSEGMETDYMTEEMRRLFGEECALGRAPVRMEAAERAILSRLRSLEEDEFARFDEGGEGLFHRFYSHSRTAASVRGLLEAVKTKRYSYSRLSRMLMRLYTGAEPVGKHQHVPYIRVLAMNEKGKHLLHRMRGSARLPVVLRAAETRRLSPASKSLMETEAHATDLYALAYPDLRQSTGGSEWTTSPVILNI